MDRFDGFIGATVVIGLRLSGSSMSELIFGRNWVNWSKYFGFDFREKRSI